MAFAYEFGVPKHISQTTSAPVWPDRTKSFKLEPGWDEKFNQWVAEEQPKVIVLWVDDLVGSSSQGQHTLRTFFFVARAK